MTMMCESIEHVRKLALCDEVLNRDLRWWHRKQGSMPTEWRGLGFDDWMDELIGHVATQIAWRDQTRQTPSDEDILVGIRVQATGDFLALYLVEKAKSCCVTDVNCYVEEGVVYSNIWLRSGYADLTYDKAREIAEQFMKVGYSAEVIVEDEDNREVTVCAQIDFTIYRDMARSGRKAEAVFMCPAKCGTISCMKTENKSVEKKSVEDRVFQVVNDEMVPLKVRKGRDTKFVEDLKADELDMIELVMALEEEFGFVIPDKDAEGLKTVGDAIDCIKKKIELLNGKKEAKEAQA